MRSVSRHFIDPETAGPKFKLECPKCGWRAFRYYNQKHDGFGICNHCGTAMVKYFSKTQQRKLEKIQAELKGQM